MIHTCQQCGTCCRKGGPLLHEADLPLISDGHIPLSALVTLRAGELAHDPVTQQLSPLEHEVIKIDGTKEKETPWHCVLYVAQGCSIHPHRPAQCAALFCQAPEGLRNMYTHQRLTRAQLLPLAPEGWKELAAIHEEACSLEAIRHHASHFPAPHAAKALTEAIQYDRTFRQLCQEKAAMPATMLACVLGRPIELFLRTLGIDVRQTDEKTLQFIPCAKPHTIKS